MPTEPSAFILHPRLAADTFLVTEGTLSSVLLMNNSLFPWIVLVPRVEAVSEIVDLTETDQHRLMGEIALASRAMQYTFTPDKLNIAALGNQVPQLHIHVIARFITDSAWPNPVWGSGIQPYAEPGEVKRKLQDFYRNQR